MHSPTTVIKANLGGMININKASRVAKAADTNLTSCLTVIAEYLNNLVCILQWHRRGPDLTAAPMHQCAHL